MCQTALTVKYNARFYETPPSNLPDEIWIWDDCLHSPTLTNQF
jgi:hypothetical protein